MTEDGNEKNKDLKGGSEKNILRSVHRPIGAQIDQPRFFFKVRNRGFFFHQIFECDRVSRILPGFSQVVITGRVPSVVQTESANTLVAEILGLYAEYLQIFAASVLVLYTVVSQSNRALNQCHSPVNSHIPYRQSVQPEFHSPST